MSYLENGSTHRSLFRLMPPLHHDADPNRSQVLAHIVENTGWDMGRAIRAFNSMRNPRSKVLVFDTIHRMWKGCDWLPADKDSKDTMLIVELRTLQRRVVAMDSELKKQAKEIKRLNKLVANPKSEAKSDDSQAGDWERELKEIMTPTGQSEYARNIESMVRQAWGG